VSTEDWSDDDSDDENKVLIGCLRGDIVGLQYYKGMVRILNEYSVRFHFF